MSTRYRVLHTTEYRYGARVQTARHVLHLTPRACAWQQVECARLVIDPVPVSLSTAEDAFGNPVSRLELTTPHAHLRVESEVSLRVEDRPWALTCDDMSGVTWEAAFTVLDYHAAPVDETLREALMMRFESPGVRVKRELELYALPSFTPARPLLDACRDLMRRIHSEFIYDPKATEVGTSVMAVLTHKRGVCQDFAHLMIGCLRAMGLAARYVSGYLLTEPPPGQPRLIGADASHAWVAVFVPGLGWVEFDPTNNCLADPRYLVLGWGRDFGDVSPIKGVIQGGGSHTLSVGVTVTPLDVTD